MQQTFNFIITIQSIELSSIPGLDLNGYKL
jgi:hypothetical protein